MADADGATKFPDVEKLEKGLSDLRPWPVSIRIHCMGRSDTGLKSEVRIYLKFNFLFV